MQERNSEECRCKAISRSQGQLIERNDESKEVRRAVGKRSHAIVTPSELTLDQQVLIAKGNHRGLFFICYLLIGQSRTVMESVVLETSLGDIQLELYWDHAPRVRELVALNSRLHDSVRFSALSQTCKNFSELARRGYYNGVIFHRIISVCDVLRTVRRLSHSIAILHSGFHDSNW